VKSVLIKHRRKRLRYDNCFSFFSNYNWFLCEGFSCYIIFMFYKASWLQVPSRNL